MSQRTLEYMAVGNNTMLFNDPQSIKNTLDYRITAGVTKLGGKNYDIRTARVIETRTALINAPGCDDACSSSVGVSTIDTTLKGPLLQSVGAAQLIRDHAANLLTLADRMSKGRMTSALQNDLLIDVSVP